MGWLQDIKSAMSARRTRLLFADMQNGRVPIYSSFGQDIYASDVVNQAMACVTNEIKKLAPVHVIQRGTDIVPAKNGDSRQSVLNAPNHYMTTFDFLGRIMYAYFSRRNSWVVPTYTTDSAGRKTYTGLYPVDPALGVDWLEDETGRLYVKLKFADGSDLTLPYSDVIHLRRDYGPDEYMGGGPGGQPDDRALLSTLEINHQMLQGISRASKTSQALNGIVKYGSVMDEEKTRAAVAEFEAKVQNSQSGVLVMDMRSEYMPLSRDIKLVDAATLKFIDEKILRTFGVSLAILTGDYTPLQHEAFFQHACEHIVVQLTQEFTRVLCTPTERTGYGHQIRFFEKELLFLSTEQKISMINLLAPTGAMYENEKRAAFGMRPLAELEGKRYISLNWIEANQASQYQLGQDTQQNNNGGANNEE